MAFGQPRIEYKTNEQMRKMHEAGLVLSRALDAADRKSTRLNSSHT